MEILGFGGYRCAVYWDFIDVQGLSRWALSATKLHETGPANQLSWGTVVCSGRVWLCSVQSFFKCE